MSRSKYKGPYIDVSLLKKIKKLKEEKVDFTENPIQVYSRRSTILPNFVGITFKIYNGNKFIKVYITEDKIGKKFGEFAHTRTFTAHAGNKERNKIKIK